MIIVKVSSFDSVSFDFIERVHTEISYRGGSTGCVGSLSGTDFDFGRGVLYKDRDTIGRVSTMVVVGKTRVGVRTRSGTVEKGGCR